jgi:ribosomal protein S18 acetylase RimI-like enzyme
MSAYQIRPFSFAEDYATVLELWEIAGPGIHVGYSDSPQEIQRKLERDPDLFLVAEMNGKVIGSVIGGYDGRRGMVYHLAVTSDQRGQGIGAALMSEIENRLRLKGCYKSYLLVVNGNEAACAFYEKRGWQAMQVTVLGKELL